MKKLFILLAACAAMVLPGCNGCTPQTVGCTVETVVAQASAVAVAQQLQCSNTAAITSDLTTVIGKVGLCKAQPSPSASSLPKLTATGLISPALCELFGSMVVSTLATQAVPSSWGCTTVNAQAKLNSIIATACEKIQ